ncbi:unnamed protein product [Timema podura]|uniref:Secreted protein n=1 Tax=Timema podura TaxID=61482 RepID=A0ABN7NGE4_TIMPD|nr:unnamed protein product [Timema podura]
MLLLLTTVIILTSSFRKSGELAVMIVQGCLSAGQTSQRRPGSPHTDVSSTHFFKEWKATLTTPDRDSSTDLPVISGHSRMYQRREWWEILCRFMWRAACVAYASGAHSTDFDVSLHRHLESPTLISSSENTCLVTPYNMYSTRFYS